MTSAPMPVTVRGLIRRYYLYSGIYTLAASVIWGINTLFLLDAGLTIAEVFVANSAFSLGTILFEIPTGVLADTVGRRASFLLSVTVLSITTLAYVGLASVQGGLLAFSAVSLLMGLGFTFYSGATESWLVDGLRFLGFMDSLDTVFSRGQIVGGAAMLTGTVVGGVLGQIDLAVPFLVRSILLVVVFALAFFGMHDLGFEPRRVKVTELPATAKQIARAGIRFGWSNPSLRLLMMATALQMGFFSWAWYAWQPYFLELLGRDAVWVAGVVAALLAVSMMVGNGIVEVVTRRCGKRTTLFIGAGGVFSVALIGVGAVTAFIPAVGLLFLGGVAIGVQAPVRQAFFHQVVPSEQRATVLSFDSLISGGGGVLGQSGLGALAGRRGFSAGYLLGGAFTLLAIPMLFLVRRHQDQADLFVGTRPESSCAVPAIPAISQLEGRASVEVL